MIKHKFYKGAVDGAMIGIIALAVGVVGMAGLSVYMYMQYNDQKTNVDSKIDLAVAESNKDLETKLEKDFQDRENAHTLEFVAPSDMGRVSFLYPRPWSVYVAKDGGKGAASYEAYFNPQTVPPVSAKQRFALRLTIETRPYDTIIKSFDTRVTRGELKSSVIKFNGHTGTRFDGSFSKDLRGSAVVFKVRDKTVVMQTDADTFKTEFDKLMKTVDFNS